MKKMRLENSCIPSTLSFSWTMVPNRQTVEASVHVVRARIGDKGNRGFDTLHSSQHSRRIIPYTKNRKCLMVSRRTFW
jgi:hypothetical protein